MTLPASIFITYHPHAKLKSYLPVLNLAHSVVSEVCASVIEDSLVETQVTAIDRPMTPNDT